MQLSEFIDEDGYLFHKKKHKPFELTPAPYPLADTHGHLTAFKHKDPVAAVVRAALAGLRMLVVPVDPADDVEDAGAFLAWFEKTIGRAREALSLLADQGVRPPVFEDDEAYPELMDNIFFVAGVHPYGASRYLTDPGVKRRLKRLLDHPLCVGVGEIGIDFGPWNDLGQEVMVAAFRDQLEIAYERDLPAELHLRDGEDDTLAHDLALGVLKEMGIGKRGVDLHCFTSGPHVMLPFTELGAHIAFGGALTFGRSEDIREAALACPDHLMLTETDCPYMAPHPLRGQEAEPAMVALTVARMADLFWEEGARERKDTYRMLWENACAFFGMI